MSRPLNMLGIKDKILLYKLQKNLEELRGFYASKIKDARKERKGENEVQEIISEMYAVCQDNEFEIEKIYTR